jgi:hypothetical protein
MTQQWSYVHTIGRTECPHSITLEHDTVTSDRADRRPNPRVTHAREVFEQSARFETSDPTVRFELLAAIAARLSEGDLSRPFDRRRLAYWKAHDRTRLAPERFAYVTMRDDRTVERAYDWRIDARGLLTTSAHGDAEQHLADELFLAGPPTPYAPAWHRARLRALLLAAQKPEVALSIDEGFRSICYRSTPRRDWRWDRSDKGESFASIEPGAVTLGYQSEHDYGTTTYVPERVLSEPWSTRISLGWPEAVREQARAALIGAGEEALHLVASVSECAEAYATLGPKLRWDARWANELALDFEGFAAVQTERQWRESAAFGLFASLCPDKPLSRPCDSSRANARTLYHRSADDLWLSTEGAAMLRAEHCFGTWAGGIDDRWHIMPSPDRRVVFAIGTDYSQSDFTVMLGADTGEALASLRAHCEAYFRALGLGPCVSRALR